MQVLEYPFQWGHCLFWTSSGRPQTEKALADRQCSMQGYWRETTENAPHQGSLQFYTNRMGFYLEGLLTWKEVNAYFIFVHRKFYTVYVYTWLSLKASKLHPIRQNLAAVQYYFHLVNSCQNPAFLSVILLRHWTKGQTGTQT